MLGPCCPRDEALTSTCLAVFVLSSNNDYFSVKWSDLDANLYWTVNLDQAVLPECQQSVNECDTMFFGYVNAALPHFRLLELPPLPLPPPKHTWASHV